MSDSLLNKFPGLKYNDFRVFNYEATLTASLAAGYFSFGTSTAYTNMVNSTTATSTIWNAVPGKWYFMDYVNIGSDLNENDFIDAIDKTFNTAGFTFDVYKSIEGNTATLSPLTFSTFRQNVPVSIYFKSNRASTQNSLVEPINFRLRGRLNQTSAITLLGRSAITVMIQTTVYEISNKAWVAKYFEGEMHK
jgi:hypothetical protein